MPQKASRSTNLVDNDDVLSQPESDDLEIEIYAKAVAEFKLTWQKQKKEKEKKFLKTAQAELDDHVERQEREIKGIMNDMEETYQDFLLKYAAVEDKIRAVISEIAEKQQTLVALSVRKHQESVELTSNLEESQLDSLKQIKQMCQDFAGMTETFMKV